jgi:putative transposase
VFAFIEAEKDHFPVATLCRLLGVSRSGYYAWRKRPPSARARADQELTQQMRAVHEQSRGTSGAPRIWAELRDRGTVCSRKRVARLLRLAG